MQEASPYLGLGMQIAMSMVFFVGGGYLLDQWLTMTPWLTIVGACLGMVAIFVQLIRVTKEINQRPKPSKRTDTAPNE